MTWWQPLLGLAAALLLAWIALILLLWRSNPGPTGIRDTLRLLPDLLRLLRRLATDRTLPRPARIRLWLLLAYLAIPIDLIPDFIPVIGYADDAILIAITLRSVMRQAGPALIERHWAGTPQGLAALRALTGLAD